MEGEKLNTEFLLKQIIRLLSEIGVSQLDHTRLASQDPLTIIYENVKALTQEVKYLRISNQESQHRINNIVDTLIHYNYDGDSKNLNISAKNDEVDALATGVNILVEELDSASKNKRLYVKNLEKSEERYKLLVEGIKDYAIFMVDINGRVASWNKGAQEIKGYTTEEIIGKHISIFYNEKELKNNGPEFNLRMAVDKGGFETNGWRVKKDGSEFYANIIFTPLYDEGGNLYGFSKITRNITEKKIAEERICELNRELEQNISQLEEVNKELESFSYSISHDLRAPLRAIHGYTNILFEDFFIDPHPEARRLMGLITYNAERMGRLVDDLLSFSQLGRKVVKKRLVNFNTLFESIISDFKNDVPDFNCTIKVHSLHSAMADYSLISQVAYNLVSNAIKYSSVKENPAIEVGSFEKEDSIIYYVKDNGVGFDMKYYHKLFGVFQRLHKVREFEGTGVGLALVQRIIFKHGGTVWAESVVTEGATFYFSLSQK